ncbi:Beta protein [Candidatus Hepatincola sp. Pdp]
MAMDYKYYPLIRTASAEIKALQESNIKNKSNVIPIIELTRGRKQVGKKVNSAIQDSNTEDLTKIPSIYNFIKNVENIKEYINYGFIDITREETLMCYELYNLLDYKDGYCNWYSFLQKDFKDRNNIPVIQITNQEVTLDDYKNNLIKQFQILSQNYNSIAYRVNSKDEDYFYDFKILENELKKFLHADKNFYVIIDFELIRLGTFKLHAKTAYNNFIEFLHKEFLKINFIVLATTFPKFITDITKKDSGNFELEEIKLFQDIIRQNKLKANILYGDYASINPIRNDIKGGARGWIPRIDIVDFPAKKMHFMKLRKETKEDPYALIYHQLAKEVIKEPFFKSLKTESWGKQAIQEASNSIRKVQGSSPSFWISVRINIYLQEIQEYLQNIYQV